MRFTKSSYICEIIENPKPNIMAKNSKLTSALKEYFGFETFKGNQEAIIENLLAEKDTFVLMPTGGGKS